MKETKFSKSVNETLDSSKFYKIEEAFSMLMNFKRKSFNESVDVAFNLGVDPRHAEENIRLSINLPHGIGKEVSVLAIVNADKEAEAKEAGADFVGKDEFLDKIKAGWTDVDKIVVTPDLMVELGKLGKVLGPKGLMPNPKSGTVTNDVAKAIKELKAGKLDARVEKNGILQSSIGKTSFTEEQLKEMGADYKVGQFPIRALGRARASMDIQGLIKIISDSNTDEVLGVHMIAPRAADLIMEAVVAMEYRASAEDIARICHPHPTYSEAVKEAALSATESRPLHI